MARIIIVVRKPNQKSIDFSLDFDLPEVPAVGSYISVFRPDSTHSEDVVVREVWWHLHHPETGSSASNPPKVGIVRDIMVECDIAVGPYARNQWRKSADTAKSRGIEVPEFQVARVQFVKSDPREE